MKTEFTIQRGDIVRAAIMLEFEDGTKAVVGLEDIAPGAGFIAEPGGSFKFSGFAMVVDDMGHLTPPQGDSDE